MKVLLLLKEVLLPEANLYLEEALSLAEDLLTYPVTELKLELETDPVKDNGN